ncbi:ABC transporter permease [Chitinispirillales bacterium ANBcel5]|uniref:ABC transporter permease n=1 Tax=Cellulosispirillum alkaliphilum TaxID=3039283 RepID=UPI002A58166A|nr:ABC transporter permease [Chitinispirillales bacterium ANBcel5]
MILSRLRDLVFVNIRMCVLELWSNKVRSVITSLGIFLGVTSLLVNLAFIRAMEEEVRLNLEAIGGLRMLTISSVEPQSSQEAVQFSRSPGLRVEDAEKLAKRYDYITSVLPQIEFRSPVSSQGRSVWVRAQAVTYDHLRVYNYAVGKGREFTRDDHQRASNVCLIGSIVARRLFGNQEYIGSEIIINNRPFRIIGTIDTEDNLSYRARQVLIPFSSYMSQFSRPSATIDEIAVELSSSEVVPLAMEQMRNELKAMHRGVEDFEIVANYAQIEEMRVASQGLMILLGSIAAISLIVGGISIMNIMFATIGDRIREIGIRKALGARQSDLFTQFLIEAVSLCFVGGLFGLIIGVVLTNLSPDLFPIRPQLAIGDYILAILFTIITGLVSGLFPALRAAKMQPVDALRY